MNVTITVHNVSKDRDVLTGKQADGVTVAFGSQRPRFLSWKSLKSLICYELQPHIGDDKPSIPMAAAK